MNNALPGFLMQNKPKANSAIFVSAKENFSFEIVAQEDSILNVDWDNDESETFILNGLPTIISKTFNFYKTRTIVFSGTGITTLNYLDCSNNELTYLNVTTLNNLLFLDCHNNSLTAFNLPENNLLITLDCHNNNLTQIALNNIISSLLTSKNIGKFDYSQYSGIEPNGQGATDKNLLIANGWIIGTIEPVSTFITTKYSVSFTVNSPAGTTLHVDWGDETAEDFSMTGGDIILSKTYGNINSKAIIFSGNGNTEMTLLNCSLNKITAIDISKNTQLTYFDCSGNLLDKLDIMKNTQLITLRCGLNNIKTSYINLLIYYLDAFNITYGTLTCNQKISAPPSGIGITGINHLLSKNWTVISD